MRSLWSASRKLNRILEMNAQAPSPPSCLDGSSRLSGIKDACKWHMGGGSLGLKSFVSLGTHAQYIFGLCCDWLSQVELALASFLWDAPFLP